MGHADRLVRGDYNVICDICGFKYKYSECKMQWNNLLACRTCYEERNPQDFVRSIKEDRSVPVARPDIVKFITSDVTPEDLG